MTSNPALILIVAALALPFVRGQLRTALIVAAPVAAMAALWVLDEGSHGTVDYLGLTLDPVRVDGLSRAFASGFLVAALLTSIYAIHLRDSLQQAVILVYAASAVGGVLAGDLVTLFVCWEVAGLSSAVLVWAGRTERSHRAAMRYLTAQVVSGLLLLAGIVWRVEAGDGTAFTEIGSGGTAGWLILVAIGIKAAFPVLHAWLTDTYPEATIVGTVALSAFTTKFAIYTLARGFPGTDALIWIGVAMAVFPIFYAVIENDLRRVLAYSMINQLGFMVVGIGIGSELGINGATAHAVADMVFKGLLFMSMGAVLMQTGTVKGSELGGLYKSMPQTTVLCIVGAASISAFPLFSGFVTKSLILQAVADEHRTWVWLLLLFASAGVFHHAGIKIPYFAFFAHDRGYRVGEPPINMRIAMGLAAVVCIGIGCAPGLFYDLLPYEMDYDAYTTAHVVNQLQLLLFAALAFTVLVRTGLYPPEIRSVNLDVDALYRKPLPAAWAGMSRRATDISQRIAPALARGTARPLASALRPLRPDGRVGAPWPTHVLVLWATLLLGVVLLVSML